MLQKEIARAIPSFSYKAINERLELYIFERSIRENTFAEDVKKGLCAEKKALPPKYFYNDRGSELFEDICKTEEYYPTRTEEYILKNFSDDIYEKCKDKKIIAELGSGSSVKTPRILEAFLKDSRKVKYIPLDVSDILIESSERLLKEFPGLNISGIISEYITGFRIIKQIDPSDKLILFLGSSIGNFTLDYAKEFITKIGSEMNDNDSLLIGFDLKKDRKVLLDAYNDSKGITAEFNLNLLKRINDELEGSFDLSAFEHKAIFNEEKSRIEMHLISKKEQDVLIKGINETVHFNEGETIHTENSYKFDDELITSLAVGSELSWVKTWNDPNRYFALSLFEKS